MAGIQICQGEISWLFNGRIEVRVKIAHYEGRLESEYMVRGSASQFNFVAFDNEVDDTFC